VPATGAIAIAVAVVPIGVLVMARGVGSISMAVMAVLVPHVVVAIASWGSGSAPWVMVFATPAAGSLVAMGGVGLWQEKCAMRSVLAFATSVVFLAVVVWVFWI
jgi:hypothetical protein